MFVGFCSAFSVATVYVVCAWGLPATAHSILLPSISCRPPLLVEIDKRFISYIQRCLASDSKVVKFVTNYGVGVGRMTSPTGSSAQFCSTKFVFTLRDIHVVLPQICSKNFFSQIGSRYPGITAISGPFWSLFLYVTVRCLCHQMMSVVSYNVLCTSCTIP